MNHTANSPTFFTREKARTGRSVANANRTRKPILIESILDEKARRCAARLRLIVFHFFAPQSHQCDASIIPSYLIFVNTKFIYMAK